MCECTNEKDNSVTIYALLFVIIMLTCIVCIFNDFFYFSENYILKWGNQGMPRDIEMFNNLRALFTVCYPFQILN